MQTKSAELVWFVSEQEPDYTFLALTVQTLVDSVVEITGAQCPLSQR